MYDNITGLHFQFLIDILEKLRGLSRKVIEELTNWLCLADSEGHFNMDVTVGLIRFALVDVSDYTLKLSRLFSNDRIGQFFLYFSGPFHGYFWVFHNSSGLHGLLGHEFWS